MQVDAELELDDEVELVLVLMGLLLLDRLEVVTEELEIDAEELEVETDELEVETDEELEVDTEELDVVIGAVGPPVEPDVVPLPEIGAEWVWIVEVPFSTHVVVCNPLSVSPIQIRNILYSRMW